MMSTSGGPGSLVAGYSVTALIDYCIPELYLG